MKDQRLQRVTPDITYKLRLPLDITGFTNNIGYNSGLQVINR